MADNEPAFESGALAAVEAYLLHLDDLGPYWEPGDRPADDDGLGYSIDGFGDYELRQGHLAALVRSPVLSEVRRVRQFAREEQRRVINEGRADEPMTLMQHWSAIGGFLDWWMRVTERGDDPTMPDAMRSGITAEEPTDG